MSVEYDESIKKYFQVLRGTVFLLCIISTVPPVTWIGLWVSLFIFVASLVIEAILKTKTLKAQKNVEEGIKGPLSTIVDHLKNSPTTLRVHKLPEFKNVPYEMNSECYAVFVGALVIYCTIEKTGGHLVIGYTSQKENNYTHAYPDKKLISRDYRIDGKPGVEEICSILTKNYELQQQRELDQHLKEAVSSLQKELNEMYIDSFTHAIQLPESLK